MTFKIIYVYDDEEHTFMKEFELIVKNRKQLNEELRQLEKELREINFHIVDVQLIKQK